MYAARKRFNSLEEIQEMLQTDERVCSNLVSKVRPAGVLIA